MTKLSSRKIKWAIDEVVKHKKSTKSVAFLSKVTQRRIQQLVRIYRETKKISCLQSEEIEAVERERKNIYRKK